MAGFDATMMRDVKVELASIFGPGTHDAHLNRDTPIFNSVAGGQRVRFDGDVRMALLNGKHCEAVEATFLLTCDLSVQDCTTDCAIPSGPEQCTESVLFEPSICFEVVGSVKDFECTNEITEAQLMAREQARMLAALDQELEKRFIAYLISQSDDLTDIADEIEIGGLDANATIWEVPPADWNAQMFIDLECITEDCEFIDPKIIYGKVWRKILAKAAAANCNCSGDSCGGGDCHKYDSLLGSIPSASNIREFDSLLGASGMLLIDNAKLGYFNRWIHESTTPQSQGDGLNTHYYYVNSQKARWSDNGSITPVKYDWYWQRVCTSEDNWEVKMKGKHRGGFVCHPDGCDGEPNKKVIQIHKKECSTC